MEYQYNQMSLSHHDTIQKGSIQMNDSEWNQNRYKLRQIISKHIHKKQLDHKQNDIFFTLDNIIQNMKSQVHIFGSKTELNKAILNEIGLYITESITNDNVSSVSSLYSREQIKQHNNNRIQNDFSNKKIEFESLNKPKQPAVIQIEETVIDNDNSDIEHMLQKEIKDREYFDSSISNMNESSQINDYQVIETPVFSLSSSIEPYKNSEKNEREKSNSKQLKSILKTSSKVFSKYPSCYTKWFIHIETIYIPLHNFIVNDNTDDPDNNGNITNNKDHFLFKIKDDSLLSFINKYKNEYTSLCINNLCLHFEDILLNKSLHNNLVYMYIFKDSETTVYTNSILFMEDKSNSQNPSYLSYKGICPVNNYDNSDNEQNNTDITNIVFTTIPLYNSNLNFNFSLVSNNSEYEKREKISIQLKF